MGNARHFVVIDSETTGFASGGRDRIVELAAIKYDDEFNEIERFETLINPNRDLGAQHVHKIEAAWLGDAPTFEEISDNLLGFLNHNILVGHNVDFDLRFIEAEFERLGVHGLNLAEHAICTKKLAMSLGLPVTSYALSALCSHFKFENFQAHSALEDASATGKLMQRLLMDFESLRNFATSFEPLNLPSLNLNTAQKPLKSRPRLPKDYSLGFIPKLVEALPVTNEYSADVNDYVVYLARALSDLSLTNREVDELVRIARELGLSIEEVALVHRDYFSKLVTLAWLDGTLSEFEKAELDAVAKQLGISQIDYELAISEKSHISQSEEQLFSAGELVVLTGTMTPPKSEVAKIVLSMGGLIGNSLTKKTRLLIAADVNTLSTKGQAARKWGIRVISTSDFIRRHQA